MNTTTGSGKYIISQDDDTTLWEFHLVTPTNRTILSNEGYAQRSSLTNAIKSIQHHALDERMFKHVYVGDDTFFVLKDLDGHVLAKGVPYDNIVDRDLDIASAKIYAPIAPVRE